MDVFKQFRQLGAYEYANKIKNNVEFDLQNNDSLGVEFFDIGSLSESQLSSIAILELEKLGYKLK